MRSALVAAVLAAALCTALAGCELESNHAEAVCTAVCDCGSPLPSVHGACMAECVEEVPQISEACVECILTASCSQFDACEDVC